MGSGSRSSDDQNPLSDPLLLPPQIQSPHPPLNQTLDDSSSSYPPPISYNYSHPRPLRDLSFLLLFLLLSLSTFAFGFLFIARRNPNPNPSSCVPATTNLNLNSFSFSSSHFKNHLIWTLLATAALSVPISVALLSLLRRFARQITYAAVPLFILTPSALNVYWFVACSLSSSCSSSFPLPYRILLLAFLFLLIALLLFLLVANWARVDLTVRILAVAAAALEDNLRLLAVLPSLSAGLLVYLTPVVVFLVFARQNGRAVPRERGEGEFECVWKEDGWVPAYFALAIVTMIWSAAVMVEAQVYVVSGTIAQWYFVKDGEKPSRSIRSSLRNAFGPSFGTVCFSGMVMGAIRVVRAIVDSAQQEENAQGFVNLMLRCCTNFLLASFDFVNKFTINFAAITGEAYCASAKMTYELLKRNLLSAVFVETVSTRILAGITFVLSTLYAITVYAILHAINNLGVETYVVAALAWLLLILVLGYFIHVLDNVIETIYVCYAIDRDKGDVCKQEVHEVYVMLPITRSQRSSLVNRTPLLV